MVKYTLAYFWKNNGCFDGFKVELCGKDYPTKEQIYASAEKIFIETMEELGKSKKEIDSIDYQLAVFAGWSDKH